MTYSNTKGVLCATFSAKKQGCFTKSNSVFRVYSDDKEIAR